MVFLIVPAHNEAERIGAVVQGLKALGFTVVVVDDGSTDETSSKARTSGAVVIRHFLNRGQGAALETGDEYARRHNATAVVHFDGDGQMKASDIAPALHLVESGEYDVVLGSRFLDKRSRLPWSKRHVVLPISRWINFVFTGVKLTDAHNGFRILNRKALEHIRIRQDGMAHNSEIIAQVKKFKLRFIECPVEVVYHEYGQGVRGGMRVLADLIKALFL